MHKLLICIAVAAATVSLQGCSAGNFPGIYKAAVRQGNYIDEKSIAQLTPGMTKRQVQFLLGTPLIADPFHQGRWDYVYTYTRQGQPAERRHLTLYFEGDQLSRIEPNAGGA